MRALAAPAEFALVLEHVTGWSTGCGDKMGMVHIRRESAGRHSRPRSDEIDSGWGRAHGECFRFAGR